MFQQASKIIRKFGGAGPLSKAIARDRSTIHKWEYPEERGGTGGLIPSSAVDSIVRAAELLGIDLTPEDWTP